MTFEKYNPELEYKVPTRREINLEWLRQSRPYRRVLQLGFKEDTSHQQELNNTLKFVRIRKKQKEKGHDDVFYTIHPSGTVRRYNPPKSPEVPEGSGNDIKRFPAPFKTGRDYIKALNYLWQYLRRKEQNKDFR